MPGPGLPGGGGGMPGPGLPGGGGGMPGPGLPGGGGGIPGPLCCIHTSTACALTGPGGICPSGGVNHSFSVHSIRSDGVCFRSVTSSDAGICSFLSCGFRF